MIANQIIKNSIEQLNEITKIDFSVFDLDGTILASTIETESVSAASIVSFIDSQAENQLISQNQLFKVFDGDEVVYVLCVHGLKDEEATMGRVAVSQLQQLNTAYKEKFDKNNFFQNLILDNLLLVDIYNKAKKLRIPSNVRRCVMMLQVAEEVDVAVIETLKSLYTQQQGDYVTAVNEGNVILIKSLGQDESYEALDKTARTIVDMVNSEAMVSVKVSYGTIVEDLKEISKSYKEAQMAMDVGKIFYNEKTIVGYNTLGIGRLIYQLPTSLCELFMKEIFGDNIPDNLDEEMLATINKFFENNLNVSEASRQLYIHRNTLVYRIEKLMKSTGLDIRNFDDALTFKIALMVVNYMKYLKNKDS